MFVTCSAWADWEFVSVSDDGIKIFIDPTTIRKDGHMRLVWELQDRKKREATGEISFRARQEYDCKLERVRVIWISSHTGPMGTGETKRSGSVPAPWDDIPPRTPFDKILKFVCAK